MTRSSSSREEEQGQVPNHPRQALFPCLFTMVPRAASTALTSAAGAELQVLHLENHPRGYSLPAAGGPVALTSLITTEVLCCNTALPKGKRQMQLELGVASVMNTAFASLHFAWKLKACSSSLSSSDYPSTTRAMEKSCLQARGDGCSRMLHPHWQCFLPVLTVDSAQWSRCLVVIPVLCSQKH